MKGLLKRAAVLCRVSTEDQAEGTSLDTQAEICMEEAKRRGYHVTEEDVYKEDGYSGALGIDARPVLHQLWEKYQAGEYDAIFVYRQDIVAITFCARNKSRNRIYIAAPKVYVFPFCLQCDCPATTKYICNKSWSVEIFTHIIQCFISDK